MAQAQAAETPEQIRAAKAAALRKYPQHIVGYPHLSPIPDLIRELLQKDKVRLTAQRGSQVLSGRYTVLSFCSTKGGKVDPLDCCVLSDLDGYLRYQVTQIAG